VGHASRSCGLLLLEANHARVSESGLKTVGGATAGGTRGTIAEVASDEVEDGRVDATGYVGPCYPYFVVFYVLGPSGIVVF
jgi:hypothetical protein